MKTFWSCGDRVLIDFAKDKVGLNREEKEVLHLLLDDCRSQEKAAEIMDISRTKVQCYWNTACRKLLSQEWLKIYATVLEKRNG